MILLSNNCQGLNGFCYFLQIMKVTFSYTNSFFLMDMKKNKLKIFKMLRITTLTDNHDVDVIEMNGLTGVYSILIVENVIKNCFIFNVQVFKFIFQFCMSWKRPICYFLNLYQRLVGESNEVKELLNVRTSKRFILLFF